MSSAERKRLICSRVCGVRLAMCSEMWIRDTSSSGAQDPRDATHPRPSLSSTGTLNLRLFPPSHSLKPSLRFISHFIHHLNERIGL
ncbi:hypothetical protein CEXT_281731 [Caerostris extrusa]|uniref:Uncharacterized protein n=1 Tax=Caerostris extrusa TaxID=172846 RepID=A0AAV4XS06_CAEEX|nr:hypothetical protein CEXT_281731 [Caerostris extrusa]